MAGKLLLPLRSGLTGIKSISVPGLIATLVFTRLGFRRRPLQKSYL